MVTRVTTAMQFNFALRAIQRTQIRIKKVQEEIITGKRIQNASDDPAGFAKVLNLRRLIGDSNQFKRNIVASTALINVTDVTIQGIRDMILQARTIAVGQAGAPSDSTTRAAAANQVASLRQSIIQFANTQVGQRYIFSGTRIFTQAYNASGEYQGNQGTLDINVAINDSNDTNVVGSDFLSTDLDPDLYITSAMAKSSAVVTDEFVIDGTNDGLVIRDQPSGTSTTITLASATYTGDQLATEATLKINNSIKVVTASNNTIKILEDNGAVSDTITVAAGVTDGATLAANLQVQINASVVLTGSTAAGGAGYTVTYNAPTDEFTITGGAPATSVGVDVTAGNDLAAVMGYTKAPAFGGLANTSDSKLFGTTVSYDEVNDQFTIQRTGVTATDFEVLSVATDAASTAAAVFGFTLDSVQGTSATSDNTIAFNVITGVNDTFSVAVDGGTNTAITVAAGVYTGENLASEIQLKINNSVKEVTTSNRTIKILEDGGVRSDTITITAGTKTGAALAVELQTAINASTILTGSTAAGGAGYTVAYSAATDKFTITTAAPAVSTGVEVGNDDLATLMGYTAKSPFGASVISDTNITGAKVDYDASFKDSFTVTSPTLGTNSSIALTVGGTDILATLNLDAPTVIASKSTLLSDLSAGKGVESGSISITNRAGQVFTVDLSTALTLTDVFDKIKAAVTGVDAAISSDGKRIILTDTNSPKISNLIVTEIGNTTTAADLGIKANVPGNIAGQDIDPRVSSVTPVSILRNGAGVNFGKVDVGGKEVELSIGSRVTVNEITSAITGVSNAIASISNDGKYLEVASSDSGKSILITDVTGSASRDLGFQGGDNVLGLLKTLEEALLRNDEETIGKTLDEFTSALDRIAVQQSKVGEVSRQFDRINEQQDEIILSFAEVLTREEDTDLTQAITEFSILQTSLEAAFASTARILQVSLLEFLV